MNILFNTINVIFGAINVIFGASSGQGGGSVIVDDNPTPWFYVDESPVHVNLKGVFNGAAVALEQRINGTPYPVRDVEKMPIFYDVAVDDPLNLQVGDVVRFNPSGTGEQTQIDYKFSGTRQY